MELMSSFTDTKFIHIRYRGGGPALNDALAGHVPVSMLNIVQALPHVQAGRIIPLAVTDFTEAAKSHETLTPPLKSPRALISLGKIEIGGVILRVQP